MNVDLTERTPIKFEFGGRAQDAMRAHTNPFPQELYTTLRQDHPDLPVEMPKFESHHANLSLRRLLMDKLSIVTRRQRNLKDGNYKLQWGLQKKQTSIKKAIEWIESWGAAEKQQRDAAKKAGVFLPSVGRPTSHMPEGPNQSAKGFSNPEQKGHHEPKLEKMSVMGRARQEGITVIVTIIYKNLNDISEKEFAQADQGVKVIFEKLPYSTMLSAILQSLGATDPSSDFLDFSLNPKDIRRSRSGEPINFPANMRRIGWGSTTQDGRQVKLIDMLSHVKEGAENTVLKCRLSKMWEPVESFKAPDQKFKSIPEPANIHYAQSRLVWNCNRLIKQQQQKKESFDEIQELFRGLQAELAIYAEETTLHQQQTRQNVPNDTEARHTWAIEQMRTPVQHLTLPLIPPERVIQESINPSPPASNIEKNEKMQMKNISPIVIPEKSDSGSMSGEHAEQSDSDMDSPILNFKLTLDDLISSGDVVLESGEANLIPTITPIASPSPHNGNLEHATRDLDAKSDSSSSSNSTIVVIENTSTLQPLTTSPIAATATASGGVDEPLLSYTASAYAEHRAMSFEFAHDSGGSGAEGEEEKTSDEESQDVQPLEAQDSPIVTYVTAAEVDRDEDKAEEADKEEQDGNEVDDDDDDDDSVLAFVLQPFSIPEESVAAPAAPFEGDNLISFD